MVQDVDIQGLRTECGLANKFWGRAWAGLLALTYREKGEGAAKSLTILTLAHHQKDFYLEGLRKLGIRDDEPAAVRAAKYHYLTNAIGGLAMEYVEESPKKVWVRYLAPMWTYAGVAMMAIPASIRRHAGEGWHAKNGELMGAPRLGWVSTKCIMDMEPYDEGYFIEYDHDLAPGEGHRFQPSTRTPEFDPSKAPRLDPEVWPEARILKARRSWMRSYFRDTVNALLQLYGQQTVHFLVSQVMRGVAIQFTHELKQDLGIEDSDAKAIADLLYALQRASGRDAELTDSKGTYRLLLRAQQPFEGDVAEGLRAALFEFPIMAARQINGRVSVMRVPDGEAEAWEIRDVGRWLW